MSKRRLLLNENQLDITSSSGSYINERVCYSVQGDALTNSRNVRDCIINYNGTISGIGVIKQLNQNSNQITTPSSLSGVDVTIDRTSLSNILFSDDSFATSFSITATNNLTIDGITYNALDHAPEGATDLKTCLHILFKGQTTFTMYNPNLSTPFGSIGLLPDDNSINLKLGVFTDAQYTNIRSGGFVAGNNLTLNKLLRDFQTDNGNTSLLGAKLVVEYESFNSYSASFPFYTLKCRIYILSSNAQTILKDYEIIKYYEFSPSTYTNTFFDTFVGINSNLSFVIDRAEFIERKPIVKSSWSV